MKIVGIESLPGPNIYSHVAQTVVVLDLDALAGWTVGRLDAERRVHLAQLLPDLAPLALAADTPLPDLFAHVLSALLAKVGSAAAPATSRAALGVPNRYLVTARYETPPVAREAAHLALALVVWTGPRDALVNAAAQGGFDAAATTVRRFVDGTRGRVFDQTTRALVREAERRGIPWYRPDEVVRIVQFGQGVRQVRIRETVTTRTSEIAVATARSKSLVHRLMATMALPTTQQIVAATEEAAVRAAEQIGYPVVVKPDDRGASLAVSVGLADRAAVVSAFRKARQVSNVVLVEGLVRGEEHRLLVVDGHFVAGARRIPAHVVGDGRRTVAALVDEINGDPRRGRKFASLLVRIELDDEADRVLAQAGLARTSVPASGQQVLLRRASNISAGGTSVDVTRLVHPDNVLAAERAVRLVGLDIAGVDFMTPDIGRSWREAGGAILEVNPSPGLRPHWNAVGSPDVTAIIMNSIAPRDVPMRIPIVAVTGTNGKTTTTQLVARILARRGRVVGTATTYGVRIGDDVVARGDLAGYNGARMLLLDPRVEAAVVETARRGLIRRGLGYDACDVGAVLNVGSDHVGMDGIATVEDLARVKRLVVAHAREMAVLNADDTRCVALAEGLQAKRIAYVSFARDNPVVQRHVAARGPAVWLDESAVPVIVLFDGAVAHTLVAVAEVPIAMGGAARHNVQNAMFAAAITVGLGETLDAIRDGLCTFVSDPATNPGRFNLYDKLPFRVLIEYAHNAEAMEAAAAFVRGLDITGRRIAVLWSQGNRMDAHYAALGRAAAPGFDRFICTEPPDPRGRAPGEISRRIGEGLREAGVSEDRIEIVADEDRATRRALDVARRGDFVLICCRDGARAWRQLVSFVPSAGQT